MISLETVRQSFRSSTIASLILSIIQLLFSLIGLGGLFLAKAMLNNPEFSGEIEKAMTEQGLSAEQIAEATSPWIFTILGVTALILLVIIIFSFINLSRTKKDKPTSMIPLFLGIGLSAYSLLTSLFEFSVTSISIQGAILALYIYALIQGRKYNIALEEQTTITE